MITYKGYTALLEVDIPTGTIVGHVIGIRDQIVFQGETAAEAIDGFHKTVDAYLRCLAEEGQEPERPFSGRFNVRIDPETHRALVLDAEARQLSLNEVVKRAFAAYLAHPAGESDVRVTGKRRGRITVAKAAEGGDRLLRHVGGGTDTVESEEPVKKTGKGRR
jgi:predicted HicB family RNase H-like nuclease